MLYEKIKQRVADGVGKRIRYLTWSEATATALLDALEKKRPPRQSLAELETMVRKIILDWDVRLVGKLRELFPGDFPASLRKGPLVAVYNDRGDWEVVRDMRDQASCVRGFAGPTMKGA